MTNKRKNKLINLTKEQLYNLYIVDKLSAKEIAKIYQVNSSSIWKKLNKFNIKCRNGSEANLKHSNLEYKTYEWLYQQYIINELSSNEIAKIVKITPEAILNWLKFYKIPIRKSSNILLNTNIVNQFKSFDYLNRQYVINNKTTTEIAFEIGINQSTIQKWLKNFCIPIRETPVGKSGKDNPSWRGGITSLNKSIRTSSKYNKWRNDCLERDNFICQKCFQKFEKTQLNVDHIKPFSVLMEQYKINSLEQANSCNSLWNTENGRTLCIECHKKTETYAKNFKYIKKLHGEKNDQST